MSDASLIFQRDDSLLVTPGDGLDRVLAIVRQCAQLRAIIAGNYVYALSHAALWGSAARGGDVIEVLGQLASVSGMPVPSALAAEVAEVMSRYGAIEVVQRGTTIELLGRTPSVLAEIGLLDRAEGSACVALDPREVAAVKLAAVRAGWPIIDRRGTVADRRPISLLPGLRLRPYQIGALASFSRGRDGVVLLPCGAGKTIIGIAAAAEAGGPVLTLVPSRTVGEQWQHAFRSLTNCDCVNVGWVGDSSDSTTVMTATYQAATSGKAAGELAGRRWGLVIYDEAQSLPADVFRMAAELDADRRLGLSATLVREDGRESEVFALVGPPLYEASWLELERDGWIAPARCVEVRVPTASTYAEQVRYKMAVVERLLERHASEQVIIVGTDVASLRATGKRLGFPVLTGESSIDRRAEVFAAFRSGAVPWLGVSRIGSVGIDLPDASVLIQVTGTYGSRQEEAQRLGRILRPGTGKTASFYTIVVEGTREQHFAARRQRFLVNQGYVYDIVDASSLPRAPRETQ